MSPRLQLQRARARLHAAAEEFIVLKWHKDKRVPKPIAVLPSELRRTQRRFEQAAEAFSRAMRRVRFDRAGEKGFASALKEDVAKGHLGIVKDGRSSGKRRSS